MAAEFSTDDCPGMGEPCVLKMTGPIVSGDFQRYKASLDVVRKRRDSLVYLYLDSPGDDLYEAILIAEALNKDVVSTAVPPKYTCASACVFILAGGVVRIPYGQVVIHRPYSLDSDSETQARNFFAMRP